MLKYVIGVLKQIVGEVVVISSDEEVLRYVDDMGVVSLKEEGATDLNGALTQAIKWCSKLSDQVLIVPSDVPLMKIEHVDKIIKLGECSFFEHLKIASKQNWQYAVFDSFYMSLDVNTAEDLGEIMLHGLDTATRSFLKSIGLEVSSNHGKERLRIKRSTS